MKPIHGVLVLGLLTGCATNDYAKVLPEREMRNYHQAAASDVEEPKTAEAPDIAAETLTGSPLLEAYIQIAIHHNTGLHAAFDRWISAMERIPQVTSLSDPQFTWMVFVEEVQTRTGPQRHKLSLAQKFPWFGKLKLQGDAAAHQAESLWWEVEAKRLAVVRDVKDAYFEYAYLGRAVQIVRENLILLQNLEPIVQRRVQVGGGQADLIRLQVQIGTLENDLASLRDFQSPLSARLRSVMNRTNDGLLPWPTLDEYEPSPLSKDELRAQLYRLNPELKRLIWQIQKTDSLAKRARLERFPDITLGVTYIDTDKSGPLPVPPENTDPPRFPSGSGDDPWGITLGFNVPIWQKKYNAGVREARAMQSSFEHEMAQKRFSLVARLEFRVYEADDAARQISLYQKTLIPRAIQALEVTEISYESGGASILDVIDVQRELLAFQKAYWRFVATHQQRLADLEVLCGGPVT